MEPLEVTYHKTEATKYEIPSKHKMCSACRLLQTYPAGHLSPHTFIMGGSDPRNVDLTTHFISKKKFNLKLIFCTITSAMLDVLNPAQFFYYFPLIAAKKMFFWISQKSKNSC